jgi:hypothetical protein
MFQRDLRLCTKIITDSGDLQVARAVASATAERVHLVSSLVTFKCELLMCCAVRVIGCYRHSCEHRE